jgi:RNA polymerase sigma factor (sigma-70 family)
MLKTKGPDRCGRQVGVDGMAFPETRQTLIQRLASTSDDEDWRQFLNDYWGPVCRFAQARASLSAVDSEDVASLTFEAVLSNQLLARWMLNQSAKLRTLLCSVVRNVISNRARVNEGRERIMREIAESGATAGVFRSESESEEQLDVFYKAWVEDILEQAVRSLFEELHGQGKGDYFRVLYSRICEEMAMPEIAEALSIPLTTVENYFKSARKQLAATLEARLHAHVARYCPPEKYAEEAQEEWQRLGDYLARHGGLEATLRRAVAGQSVVSKEQHKTTMIRSTISRIHLAKKP